MHTVGKADQNTTSVQRLDTFHHLPGYSPHFLPGSGYLWLPPCPCIYSAPSLSLYHHGDMATILRFGPEMTGPPEQIICKGCEKSKQLLFCGKLAFCLFSEDSLDMLFFMNGFGERGNPTQWLKTCSKSQLEWNYPSMELT